ARVPLAQGTPRLPAQPDPGQLHDQRKQRGRESIPTIRMGIDSRPLFFPPFLLFSSRFSSPTPFLFFSASWSRLARVAARPPPTSGAGAARQRRSNASDTPFSRRFACPPKRATRRLGFGWFPESWRH